MWRQAVRECVAQAVGDKGKLTLVLSPDVDGVMASVIVSIYAKNVLGVDTEIIGTYDANCLRLTGSATMADAVAALWIDLDVRFRDVRHVLGQHFLGNVQVCAPGYFNPNLFFDVRFNMSEKCPISTTHLVLWGLFDDETDASRVLGNKYSLARSVVAHADSLYMIVEKYEKNVRAWAKKLFPDGAYPKTFAMLLDGSYKEGSAKVHRDCLRGILPFLNVATVGNSWSAFRGHQTVSNEDHMGSVRGMLGKFAAYMRAPPPLMQGGERVVWSGERKGLSTVEYDWGDDTLDNTFDKQKVVSHAIVNARTISITVGKELGVF